MASIGQYEAELLRTRFVQLVICLGFLFLGIMMWRIQVLHTYEYMSSLDRQSMRRVRLPGVRGAIYDRNGVCLARNRPSYCIAVYVEELRRPGRTSNTVAAVDTMLDGLAEVIGLKKEAGARDIANHLRRRRPLPLLAWHDIGREALARWAECSKPFPGVDVYVAPVRDYPQGAHAAHVVGYVGQLDADMTEEAYHYYLPDMEGRAGMERTMNERLVGVAGGSLLRVDASGFRHGETIGREPEAGADVMLTLDLRIQQAAERMLEGRRGAAVVIDPRNGDVLALASSPAFDPRSMRDRRALRKLMSDPDHPMYDRAVAGRYPPGSIFKPLVAIAALENRRATGSTAYDCPGYFEIGGARFHCWRRRGHGSIAMRKAIEQSCNAYFCQLGLQCGYERIYHMADALQFGYRLGIELPGESGGLLPDNAWKERTQGDSWRSGDTCNVSIGQGPLLVTPLQMAVFAATIANGGHVYRPRLVLDPAHREPELLNDMQWSAETLRVVRGGMQDVVQAEEGTGKRARLPDVEMAGKTGTAEYGPRSARRKYGWMITFAPAGAPRYAVAIVIEDAVSGGIDAAPRMRALVQRIFDVERGMVPVPGQEASG